MSRELSLKILTSSAMQRYLATCSYDPLFITTRMVAFVGAFEEAKEDKDKDVVAFAEASLPEFFVSKAHPSQGGAPSVEIGHLFAKSEKMIECLSLSEEAYEKSVAEKKRKAEEAEAKAKAEQEAKEKEEAEKQAKLEAERKAAQEKIAADRKAAAEKAAEEQKAAEEKAAAEKAAAEEEQRQKDEANAQSGEGSESEEGGEDESLTAEQLEKMEILESPLPPGIAKDITKNTPMRTMGELILFGENEGSYEPIKDIGPASDTIIKDVIADLQARVAASTKE